MGISYWYQAWLQNLSKFQDLISDRIELSAACKCGFTNYIKQGPVLSPNRFSRAISRGMRGWKGLSPWEVASFELLDDIVLAVF